MIAPTETWDVVAFGFDGRPQHVETGFADKRSAERRADDLFARSYVNRVEVAPATPTPRAAPGRRTYR